MVRLTRELSREPEERGGHGIAPKSHIVVLGGRHFRSFSAGDEGIVVQVDHEAQNCEVIFAGRSQPVLVALRHLKVVSDDDEKNYDDDVSVDRKENFNGTFEANHHGSEVLSPLASLVHRRGHGTDDGPLSGKSKGGVRNLATEFGLSDSALPSFGMPLASSACTAFNMESPTRSNGTKSSRKSGRLGASQCSSEEIETRLSQTLSEQAASGVKGAHQESLCASYEAGVSIAPVPEGFPVESTIEGPGEANSIHAVSTSTTLCPDSYGGSMHSEVPACHTGIPAPLFGTSTSNLGWAEGVLNEAFMMPESRNLPGQEGDLQYALSECVRAINTWVHVIDNAGYGFDSVAPEDVYSAIGSLRAAADFGASVLSCQGSAAAIQAPVLPQGGSCAVVSGMGLACSNNRNMYAYRNTPTLNETPRGLNSARGSYPGSMRRVRSGSPTGGTCESGRRYLISTPSMRPLPISSMRPPLSHQIIDDTPQAPAMHRSSGNVQFHPGLGPNQAHDARARSVTPVRRWQGCPVAVDSPQTGHLPQVSPLPLHPSPFGHFQCRNSVAVPAVNLATPQSGLQQMLTPRALPMMPPPPLGKAAIGGNAAACLLPWAMPVPQPPLP